MNVCGISVETQDAIIYPHFAYLRRSNSCVYWARETINIRYAVLVNISCTREHGKEQQDVPVAPSGDWSSQRTMAAYSTPGYVVLYKTVIQPRYRPLYDETGALADIRALYSPPPSDFSGVKMLVCLTPDVEVVEYQASYIRRRAEHTPAGIVCLCIPTNAFKTLAGEHWLGTGRSPVFNTSAGPAMTGRSSCGIPEQIERYHPVSLGMKMLLSLPDPWLGDQGWRLLH